MVVLAGGLGTRLRPITRDRYPKPMAPVPCGGAQHPFLDYVLAHYRSQGVADVVLCVGHLARQITDHFGDGSRFGLRIRYDEAEPADTGRRVANALRLVETPAFLIVCGDTYLPLDVAAFLAAFDAHPDWMAQIAAVPPGPDRPANLADDRARNVTAYDRAGMAAGGTAVDGGTLAARPAAFAGLPEREDLSLTADLYPRLIARRALGCVDAGAVFHHIGTPQGYRRFCDFAAGGGAAPLGGPP